MSILSGFRLWLPAAFARGGCFRRNGSMDSRVVEIGVMIPPAVVRLFGDLTGSQHGGLLLPGTETLLQISCMDAAIKNLSTQTDQTIRVDDAKKLSVFQGKKRVHQTVHGIDVRHGDGLGRNVQRFRHLPGQFCLGCAILGFILGKSHIGRGLRRRCPSVRTKRIAADMPWFALRTGRGRESRNAHAALPPGGKLRSGSAPFSSRALDISTSPSKPIASCTKRKCVPVEGEHLSREGS